MPCIPNDYFDKRLFDCFACNKNKISTALLCHVTLYNNYWFNVARTKLVTSNSYKSTKSTLLKLSLSKFRGQVQTLNKAHLIHLSKLLNFSEKGNKLIIVKPYNFSLISVKNYKNAFHKNVANIFIYFDWKFT